MVLEQMEWGPHPREPVKEAEGTFLESTTAEWEEAKQEEAQGRREAGGHLRAVR